MWNVIFICVTEAVQHICSCGQKVSWSEKGKSEAEPPRGRCNNCRNSAVSELHILIDDPGQLKLGKQQLTSLLVCGTLGGMSVSSITNTIFLDMPLEDRHDSSAHYAI